MAEGILFSIAGKILEGLGSLAVREGKLACGVRDEIRKLESTVNTIRLVLLDAEEQHSKMNRVEKNWIQRLKDAFYDADDLLDNFSTQLRRREVLTRNKIAKEVRIFFSNSNQIAYSLRMAHKIKTIREKLDEIRKDRQFDLSERHAEEGDRQFLFLERHGEKGVMNIERETHSFVPAEKVVGRDDDKSNVIRLLLDSNGDDNVSIITIVGLGGVGKTTLAQLVYNDNTIINNFQLRMWVCVSDDFNMKIIVEKMIISATHEELPKLHLDELQKLLRKEIDGKRYLLVLDDVWNENHTKWNELMKLLMNGSKGSKILVTTRSKVVAKITSKHESYVYPLRGLDGKKSWSLFTQEAFDHGKEPKDSKLIEFGKGIVAKCGGVPLVIMTIGQLLYGNKNEDDWLKFKDNEMSKVIKEESDILPLLKLSYDHLPSNLKQCFAYCALFPKDYKIKKQKLIHLWMAQGFLQASNKECSEDIGNKYFTALLLRSFFQEPQYDGWGNVVTCTMHDLMHDLAQLVAEVECKMQTFNNVESMDVRCRHLSLNCGEVKTSWKFPIELYKAKNIRTLLLIYQLNWEFYLNDGYDILTNYRYLRTLDFGELRFQKLLSPNGELLSLIGELRHLRYLNLSHIHIVILSNSLSKLLNLETLDLSHCYELKELPSDIKKMVNLRHLINKKCDSLVGMPHGLGHLTNLQTLSLFVVSERITQANRRSKHNGTEELNGLNDLRGKLKIKNIRYEKNSKLANLEGKQFLRSLNLDWGRSDDGEVQEIDEVVLQGLKPHPKLKKISVRSFMGLKLCDWLSSLTNLSSIRIRKCRRCQHIPRLDKLPYLKSLFLNLLDDLEYISEKASNSSSTLSATFFPSLEELDIQNCPKLKGWWRKHDYHETGQLPIFPCLSKLDIQNCPSLTFMPLYPSLEELKLRETSSKPLVRTMTMPLINKGEPSTSSRFSAPLSNLKSMLLLKIPDLESLPMSGIQKLTSLVDLKILSCPKFTQGDQVLKLLPSLQHWIIRSHEEREPEWEGIRGIGLSYIPDWV